MITISPGNRGGLTSGSRFGCWLSAGESVAGGEASVPRVGDGSCEVQLSTSIGSEVVWREGEEEEVAGQSALYITIMLVCRVDPGQRCSGR